MNKLKRFYEANRTSNKGRQINESIADNVISLVQEFKGYSQNQQFEVSVHTNGGTTATSSFRQISNGMRKYLTVQSNNLIIGTNGGDMVVDINSVKDIGLNDEHIHDDYYLFGNDEPVRGKIRLSLYIDGRIGENKGIIVSLSSH